METITKNCLMLEIGHLGLITDSLYYDLNSDEMKQSKIVIYRCGSTTKLNKNPNAQFTTAHFGNCYHNVGENNKIPGFCFRNQKTERSKSKSRPKRRRRKKRERDDAEGGEKCDGSNYSLVLTGGASDIALPLSSVSSLSLSLSLSL